MSHATKLWAVVALVSVFLLTGAAFAGDPHWGTRAALPGNAPNPAGPALGSINPTFTFTSAGYGTGGVGLRNQQVGSIVISGVNPPVQAAYLYWAVISNGPATKPEGTILVSRRGPVLSTAAVTLFGTVVGTGIPPCWPGDTITVFRATVPLTVATGNGDYEVRFRNNVFGSVAGEDPWTSATDPLLEGVSLVIVGSGSATVGIYDVGLAGHTFLGDNLSYTLVAPAPPTFSALWDNIGADGQVGGGRTADPGISGETTFINGAQVSGPGAAYADSDWDGSSGFPLPQLWDDTGHDISGTITPTAPVFAVQFNATGDCLTPVANVLAVQ